MTSEFDVSWFDLAKYESIKKFNIEDWHLQLSKRLDINMFLRITPRMVNELGENVAKRKYEAAVKNLEAIKINPVFRYTSTAGHPEKGLLLPPVRDLTFVEASLEDIFRDALEDEKKTFFDGYNKLAGVKVYVDLTASDRQLEASFNQWLKNKREETGKHVRKSCFTKETMDSWERNKILPYIDLVLVFHSEGKNLTQKELGGMLFPDEFDVGLVSRIKDTVKPKAELLLTVKMVQLMETQIQR
jgi:hypothetical protein